MAKNSYTGKRNILGQRLRIDARPDKRANRKVAQENGGKPYLHYFIKECPNDSRRWHIMAEDISGQEKTYCVKRMAARERADAELVRLQVKQPGRKLHPKLAHKLRTRRLVL